MIIYRFMVDIPFEWPEDENFIKELKQDLERGVDKAGWCCIVNDGEIVEVKDEVSLVHTEQGNTICSNCGVIIQADDTTTSCEHCGNIYRR